MQIAAFPDGPLTAIVLMRVIAICARNLCSAKTVQSMLFTVQSMLFDVRSGLFDCPRIQMAGDIFSIEAWREELKTVNGT